MIQAEDTAQFKINYLLKAASSGDAQAARALHRIAESVTLAVNKLAARDVELWNPILERAIGWPIVESAAQDEKARNAAIMARVGSKAFYRSRPSADQKSLRFQNTPTSDMAVFIGGSFNILNTAVKFLTIDSPSEERFRERLDALFQGMPEGIQTDGLRAVMKNLHAKGGFDPQTKKELKLMIFDWLDREAGGHIERISELRERGVNSGSWRRDYEGYIDDLIRESRREDGWRDIAARRIDDEDRKQFLLKSLGTLTVESCIRDEIKKVIGGSLNWFNRS